MDYLINRDWLINMSVWYMDIDTTANYKLAGAQQHDSIRLIRGVYVLGRIPVLKSLIKLVIVTSFITLSDAWRIS